MKNTQLLNILNPHTAKQAADAIASKNKATSANKNGSGSFDEVLAQSQKAKQQGLKDSLAEGLAKKAKKSKSLFFKDSKEIENRKKTFIIEEPELNLFPKVQKKLIEFMVESVNKFDNQFILPTHSPYILTSLENLMYAYKLGNAKSGKLKEKVSNIVNEKYWINPEDINAYYLNNGEAEDVMIREEYLIDKNHLDEISDVLGKTFDELIEIEIELEKDQ